MSIVRIVRLQISVGSTLLKQATPIAPCVGSTVILLASQVVIEYMKQNAPVFDEIQLH